MGWEVVAVRYAGAGTGVVAESRQILHLFLRSPCWGSSRGVKERNPGGTSRILV